MLAQSISVLLVCCSLLVVIAFGEENHSKPRNDTFTFQSKVDVVLVPVVVRDPGGMPVGDLTERDFQVFDNNKRQVISGFMLATVAPEHFMQSPSLSGPHPSTASPRHFVIFLFDDLHVAFSDLARSKEAAKKVLAELDGNELSAVVSLSGLINSGITTDRAVSLRSLAQLQPHTIYQKTGIDCPDMDYYQAELSHFFSFNVLVARHHGFSPS